MFITLTTVKGQKRYPEDLWTVEEVKKMAEKYNLQDSVSATKNTMLLSSTKEQIDQYFQKLYKFRNETNEYNSFKEKTKFVRTYDDYFKLVESMPLIKADMIQGIGGVEKYTIYKKDAAKHKWRIYRSIKGELNFVKAEINISEREKKLGQRIDNLPPQKQ